MANDLLISCLLTQVAKGCTSTASSTSSCLPPTVATLIPRPAEERSHSHRQTLCGELVLFLESRLSSYLPRSTKEYKATDEQLLIVTNNQYGKVHEAKQEVIRNYPNTQEGKAVGGHVREPKSNSPPQGYLSICANTIFLNGEARLKDTLEPEEGTPSIEKTPFPAEEHDPMHVRP
ncbi:hypothetical protein Salat_1660700 [Sesamum alatum]|uniref:Uncharacterized protein n=1 Tax=Sesamum alatum TaxID=300844 RepID=A0AAE2CJP7_9LAMI|nr:hypothetical protein Salat_1660700 [Sesamum alatum]